MSIQINKVSYFFRGHLALKEVDLILSPGEITYVLGPNGAGKSTLVGCLCGIYSRYKGTIIIPAETRMGALLDQPFIYSSLTVRDNIRIFLGYNRMEYGQYHDMLNEYLVVDELLSRPFRKLSQGQKQRVLLFVSMINNPDVFLLDEPFNGLDPFYTEKLIALLTRLRDSGSTLLINDHIISHTLRLADQIAFLISHQIIWTMRAEELSMGLYYSDTRNQDLTGKKRRSFSESITTTPNEQENYRPIEDLTDLYTIAIEHGARRTL